MNISGRLSAYPTLYNSFASSQPFRPTRPPKNLILHLFILSDHLSCSSALHGRLTSLPSRFQPIQPSILLPNPLNLTRTPLNLPKSYPQIFHLTSARGHNHRLQSLSSFQQYVSGFLSSGQQQCQGQNNTLKDKLFFSTFWPALWFY